MSLKPESETIIQVYFDHPSKNIYIIRLPLKCHNPQTKPLECFFLMSGFAVQGKTLLFHQPSKFHPEMLQQKSYQGSPSFSPKKTGFIPSFSPASQPPLLKQDFWSPRNAWCRPKCGRAEFHGDFGDHFEGSPRESKGIFNGLPWLGGKGPLSVRGFFEEFLWRLLGNQHLNNFFGGVLGKKGFWPTQCIVANSSFLVGILVRVPTFWSHRIPTEIIGSKS